MNNIDNILASAEAVEKLVFDNSGVGIKVNDITIFQKCFTHKSVTHGNITDNFYDSICSFSFNHDGNNEKLEFLGDRVIELITVDYIFRKFPQENEGFLTDLKSRIVKDKSLSNISKIIGLRTFLILNNTLEKRNARYNNDRYLEDIFESFIGALYVDQGFDITRTVLMIIFDRHIDIDFLSKNDQNYKSLLLKKHHLLKWPDPVYSSYKNTEGSFTCILSIPKAAIDSMSIGVVETSDLLLVTVDIDITENRCGDEKIVGFGIARTKKEAEQKCAQMCLNKLG